jgi:hypothetical protein
MAGAWTKMNRTEILSKLSNVTSRLLKEKGYISPVDVLLQIGWLDRRDYEAWRLGKIPFLEQAIMANLAKINFMMKTLRTNSLHGGLKPSWTAYNSWGKKGGKKLRFTKGGDPNIETAYATHFVMPKKQPVPDRDPVIDEAAAAIKPGQNA